MAAKIPTNPNPGGDDSHIFRRTPPKASPEEPTEVLSFNPAPPILDDDEDALSALGTEPSTGESPSVIVRRGYREGSGVNTGGGKLAGESGSSIFGNAPPVASSPGSGWFDSIPPAPRAAPPSGGLSKTQLVENLFSELDADSSTAPVGGWQKQPATDSISESEVLRAFDDLSSRDVTKRLPHPDDAVDFDATQPSGSHIFPHSTEAKTRADDSADSDASGVDLLNADWDSERVTGPRSSIFGAASNQEASQIELDALPPDFAEDATEHNVFNASDGGSSIFDKKSPHLSFHEQDDAIDFTEPMASADDEGSGRVNWESKPLSGEMQPSPRMPRDDDSDVDPFSDDLPLLHTPAPKRGLVGTSGAGAVVAPVKHRPPEADDGELETPKPKREPVRVKAAKEPSRSGGGGLIGWVGGGLLGLLVGAGAFAGLYFGGMLPGAETKSTVAVVQTGPNPEVAVLTAKQDEMKQELATAKDAAIKAEKDMALLKKKADFDAVSAGYAKERVDAAQAAEAKADAKLKTAIKQKDAAEGELMTAMTDLIKAEDEAKKAKLESTKVAAELKTAGANLETAKAEMKTYVALAEKTAKDLEASRSDAIEKGKLAADAAKKQVAAEAGVTAVVKELKANKLLDEKVAVAEAIPLLPDAFKKLNAMVASADAKKAADAMAALKKEVDAATAAVKATELARDELKTAVKKAEIDLLAAKKETDAAKKETETKVASAVEKATAEAKKSLGDAEAEKLALVQKQKADLTVLQAGFTQQLAEARQGGVQITPAEVQALDRAARDYNAGVSAYQSKSFTQALASLESAVKRNPADARYWYYLGLTQWELGKTTDAPVAFKKGYDLEIRGKPNAALVGDALERIQGNARRELTRYRQ